MTRAQEVAKQLNQGEYISKEDVMKKFKCGGATARQARRLAKVPSYRDTQDGELDQAVERIKHLWNIPKSECAEILGVSVRTMARVYKLSGVKPPRDNEKPGVDAWPQCLDSMNGNASLELLRAAWR